MPSAEVATHAFPRHLLPANRPAACPGCELRELIVPLRPDGTATTIQPVPPKTRAIDLRNGDQFVFQGKRETVAGIRAYRDSMTDQMPPPHREGYVYQLPDGGQLGAKDP